MTLIIDDELDNVVQGFVAPTTVQVTNIRVHLLNVNVTGSETVSLSLHSTSGLMATSNAVQAVALLSGEQAFHGQVSFDIPVMLRAGEHYFIKFQTANYSKSTGSYLAACFDFDSHTYQTSETVHPLLSPLDFEVWANTSRYPVRKI